MRPLIGLTPYFRDTPDRLYSDCAGYISPETSVSQVYYTRKIEEAGGVSVVIPYYYDGDASARILAERLDGILFTGGEDIDPKYYGEIPAGAEAAAAERDVQEFKLFEAFYSARKPILGICRGSQLMNVFFRGSLIQDIPSEGKGYIDHTRYSEGGGFTLVHGVSVEKGTLLASLTGEKVRVNTMHHQAVRKVGDGLIVAAVSEDGLIEGVERPGYPFMLGVQWHPERLNDEPHLNIFKALVESAKSASH
jgi:putative glutamine amidotransferase